MNPVMILFVVAGALSVLALIGLALEVARRRPHHPAPHSHEPLCPRCGQRHTLRYEGTPFACLKATGGSFRGVKREN